MDDGLNFLKPMFSFMEKRSYGSRIKKFFIGFITPPQGENVTLTETRCFKWAFYVPIFIGLTLCIPIYLINDSIQYSLIYFEVSRLFEVYRLPLLISGSAIPLTALSAAIHRSDQMARQIETQALQNNFANHFKHLEEFKKSIDEGLEQNKNFIKENWGSVEDFHRALYPDSKNGDLHPNSYTKEITEWLNEFTIATPEPFLNIDTPLSELSDKFSKNFVMTNNPSLNTRNSLIDLTYILNAIQSGISFSGLHDEQINVNEYRHHISRVSTFLKYRSQYFRTIAESGIAPADILNAFLGNKLDSRFKDISKLDKQYRNGLTLEYWFYLKPAQQEEVLENIHNDLIVELEALLRTVAK